MKLQFILRLFIPLLLVTAAACSTHPIPPAEEEKADDITEENIIEETEEEKDSITEEDIPDVSPPDSPRVKLTITSLRVRSIKTKIYYSPEYSGGEKIESDTSVGVMASRSMEKKWEKWNFKTSGDTITYSNVVKTDTGPSYSSSGWKVVLDRANHVVVSASYSSNSSQTFGNLVSERANNFSYSSYYFGISNVPYTPAEDGSISVRLERPDKSMVRYGHSSHSKNYEYYRRMGSESKSSTTTLDVQDNTVVTFEFSL